MNTCTPPIAEGGAEIKAFVIDVSNCVGFTTTTDSFGDFWFEGLKEGSFSLRIEAAGFPIELIDPISTMKDVNLEDIPLS